MDKKKIKESIIKNLKRPRIIAILVCLLIAIISGTSILVAYSNEVNDVKADEALMVKIFDELEDAHQTRQKEEPVGLVNLLRGKYNLKSKSFYLDSFFALDRYGTKYPENATFVLLNRPKKVNQNIGYPEEVYEGYYYLDTNKDYISDVIWAFRHINRRDDLFTLENLIKAAPAKFAKEKEYFLNIFYSSLFVNDTGTNYYSQKNDVKVIVYHQDITKLPSRAFEGVKMETIPVLNAIETTLDSLEGTSSQSTLYPVGDIKKLSPIFFENKFNVNVERFVKSAALKVPQDFRFDAQKPIDITQFTVIITQIRGAVILCELPLLPAMIDFEESDIDENLNLKGNLLESTAKIVLKIANLPSAKLTTSIIEII